ncbi:MAG: STAS/SEC14 domain-containing protein [Pirellulales bacterium]
MSEELTFIAVGKLLHVQVTGKLTKKAYQAFTPVVDEQIKEHGYLRILFEMHDFHGWTAGALWEDLKFDFHHWKDIERLAIVGESKWEAGMAVFCRPFTMAKVQYFDHTKLEDAKSWIEL